MNPGLARALGTMLKQDFQRAVLNRVHRMDSDQTRSRRPVPLVCDEYQAVATTGENEPSGDEKFFSLVPAGAMHSGPARRAAHAWPEELMSDAANHATITITIGGLSREFEAFVTSAPARLDAPSTLTLYASTPADVAMFAACDVALDSASSRFGARLILVNTAELSWQRARCREAQHLLVQADPWLAGASTLQSWLWRRLRGCACDVEIRR